MQNSARLILLLGDQLSWHNPALADGDPQRDRIVMAEVREEAQYVRHNRHKIALIFSAMRHFCAALREAGWQVDYYPYEAAMPSLEAALARSLSAVRCSELQVCEPGEYRLRSAMSDWESKLGIPVTVLPDSRFLASHADFAQWAAGRKQLRMEYFYRGMRQRYRILLEPDGSPAGGRWNYDAENRSGWRSQRSIPPPPAFAPDETTQQVIALVNQEFAGHPGDLSAFAWAVTHAEAESALEQFIAQRLPDFGRYQDALAEASPWLFHSLISMYINIGLLEPLDVCQRVEKAWREGHCDLAAAEGFIRQIVGWREYIRGMYWLLMPDYREHNTLAATRPLPDWFWSGDTDLRCLQRALRQTLDLGYAHHIQRLMVIGNFALLAGLDVKAVCDWYLAVYIDAFEWVELPNTLGMALHADGGILASKPYAASGSYIAKQGDHCRDCRFNPKLTTGANACPYNSLYWHFIDRNRERLGNNPRMGLILANWNKRSAGDRSAIRDWAEQLLQTLTPHEEQT